MFWFLCWRSTYFSPKTDISFFWGKHGVSPPKKKRKNEITFFLLNFFTNDLSFECLDYEDTFWDTFWAVIGDLAAKRESWKKFIFQKKGKKCPFGWFFVEMKYDAKVKGHVIFIFFHPVLPP